MKRLLITLALIAAGAGAANAYGTSTRSIDRVQANEAARIRAGVRDGSLTRREAASLHSEQRRIQHMESRAKADGVVTRSEQHQIRRAQAIAGRHIYQERHDSATRR